MIAVFAYAFPHRKSQDLLTELFLAGVRDVTVLAAPAVTLPGIDRARYWPSTNRLAAALETEVVAKQLGYRYRAGPHDADAAADAVDLGATLGIVAGARILKRSVIEVFEEGIVNFHPGALPETSGLDAFFYTIEANVDAGVTTHFIDPRVDAGLRTAFHPVRVGPSDTPEAVMANTYQMQIVALRRFLADRAAGNLNSEAVHRPRANRPMTPEQKMAALAHFPAWRAARFRSFTSADLHEACRAGDGLAVERILRDDPTVLEATTAEGWTPLILAVHGGHDALAVDLLSRGANPNATGRKGTTVLMYAKTPLVGQQVSNTALLDRLIAAGADPKRRDMFGHGVLHYLRDDPALTEYFVGKGAV